jgi:hypothetical protein
VPTLAFCHSETGGVVKGRAWGGAAFSVSSQFSSGSVMELRGPGGPFVGLYDSFGECRFSRPDGSLGYNVLPGLEIYCKPLIFNDSSLFSPGTPIEGEMSATDLRAFDTC